MSAVVGRAWGWVRSWGSWTTSEDAKVDPRSPVGWTSWMWGGWRRHQNDQSSSREEYWEAQEKLQAMEIEDFGAGKPETEAANEQISRWWKYLPMSYLWSSRTEPSGLQQRKHDGRSGGVWERDADGEFSDYGTPPPSPTPPPSKITSPFRLFAQSWNVEILPEHHEICFNFLRHLFDLFVVGFLWTVSPPAKLILEVLGVQGPLRLWFHGMAMFLVSTVGMAGVLWLVQEYLPQCALIYGIVQALVISVSIRQSVTLSVEEERGDKEEETVVGDSKDPKVQLGSLKDKEKLS